MLLSIAKIIKHEIYLYILYYVLAAHYVQLGPKDKVITKTMQLSLNC